MKLVRSSKGVELYETKEGTRLVYVRVQANKRQYRIKVGPSAPFLDAIGKKRDAAVEEARRKVKDYRREIREARERGEEWKPPRILEAERRQTEQTEAIRRLEARAPLLFENAVVRFKASCLRAYARPKDAEYAFAALGRMFAGMFLDDATQRHVRDYFTARVGNAGPFADWPRKVTPRTPRNEVNWLSALYNYLADEEGRALDNPCLGYLPHRRKRRKKDGLEYRPKHVAVVPTPELREALFAAAPSESRRALFKLCYYTAGRNESEPCRLLHGDVVLSDDPRAQVTLYEVSPRVFVPLGWTHVPRHQDRGKRDVPLHPDAEPDLRAILLPRPVRESYPSAEAFEAALSRWTTAPIFPMRTRDGRSVPMNRHSYRKAWHATRQKVAKEQNAPEVLGMWLRDVRKAAITGMRERGTDSAVASKVAGHSEEMSFHYTQATDAAARAAILRLGAAKPSIEPSIEPERAATMLPTATA